MERQHDSLAADTTLGLPPDSALLDSVVGAWTTDDWLDFWAEVEKEQARRRKNSDTAAGKAVLQPK